MSYFDLVESEDYNSYAWVIDVFNATVEASSKEFKTKPIYYRLYGFPLALQIWFYVCCPALNGLFVEHTQTEVPRILNWTILKHLSHDFVCLRIFVLASNEVNNILPTKNENFLLDLTGFVFSCCPDADQTKLDVDDEKSPTNVYLKKDIDGLKAHVDEKFKEILEAFNSLKNKLDVI
ncbi:hypothetical protein KY284_035672 [Solanum tuberosum]|nr:hypothetical protein KY284_035672 [Solanum tuberosum]